MRKLLSTLLILNLLGVPTLAQDVASVATPPIDANGVFDPKGTSICVPDPTMRRLCTVTESEPQPSPEGLRAAYEIAAARSQTAAQKAADAAARKKRDDGFAAVGVMGLITMIVGGVIAIPSGEEFDVFGDKFCVTNNYKTYTDGGCSVSDHRRQVGIGVFLVGLGLFTTGIVGVSANASKQGFSARATVKW